MPSGASRSDWAFALAVVFGLTAWRLAALSLDGTDLFLDEAQYWLWGQTLDWGYFSKPPMIAWVSRATTDLAGSDAVFWVRAPGSVLHGATALLTGLAAGRLCGARVGAWAAVLYVTLPLATFGSWIFSTDTVLLPFFAGALLAYLHLTERRSLGWALALGFATGCGLLSKYAMAYLPLMAALAALVMPRARIAWRDAGVAAATAFVIVLPNILWNLRNGGTTVRHLVEDNAQVGEGLTVDPLRGLEFLASQFGVFGPIPFALLLLALWRLVRGRAGPEMRLLLFLSLPVILMMTVQAIRANAYANWAVTAYIAGTALVAALLVAEFPRLRRVTLGLHGGIALAFPLLFVFPEAVRMPDGRYLAFRYLGQAELSRAVAETAHAHGLDRIVASDRAVLADLFHTLRDESLTIRALPPDGGRPQNFYEQAFALEEGSRGPVLLVTGRGRQVDCPDRPGEVLRTITPDDGIYGGRTIGLERIDSACLTGGDRR